VTRASALAVLLLALATPSAGAEPLRLRGDALATAQSPVGLLVLDGEGGVRAGLSAEAMVWLGLDQDGSDGDALVIALVARRADGRAEGRLGRFVTTAGALRPVHLDGAAARVRLPRRFDAEVFGGVPVAPRFGADAWDWVVGGRVGRRLGDWGGTGVALLERRDRGRLEARELGLDASAAIGAQDLAARVAIDLVDPTLADVTLTARRKLGAVRAELTAEHRVPSHLVPATSLFSVLGDVASERLAAAVRWRAAPRLDLFADAGARRLDGELAADGLLRATLRLDDRGRGALTAELRRTGVVDGGWYGARVAARVPRGHLTATLEGELVMPDEDRGRGTVWPWALAALGWRAGAWDAAIAFEASSTPSDRYRVDLLAQLGRRWEVP
jgi:hypothetical protein